MGNEGCDLGEAGFSGFRTTVIRIFGWRRDWTCWDNWTFLLFYLG